ncbi:hypothetical protein [Ferrovibrio sp.]|uniref:hypothetical protein n=1 Tax=Ferrovibrio sp. TaxID=1917215 RepID=UPI00311FB2A4
MLQFVTGGPTATDAFNRHRQAGQTAEMNDQKLAEADRADRLRRATDRALGDAYAEVQGRQGQPAPQPAPSVPVPAGMDAHAAASLQDDPGAAQFRAPALGRPAASLAPAQPAGAQPAPAMSSADTMRAVNRGAGRRLMGVQGARATGARLLAEDAQHEEQVFRQTIELAKSDPQQALAFARQAGANVSPQMEALLKDRTAVANWGRAMEAAAKAYPDPHQGGKRFTFATNYFRGLTSGDLPGAIQSAPAPQDTPRYQRSLTDVTDPQTGQTYKAWVDPNTGSITATGWQGAPRAPQFLYGQDGTVNTYQNGTATPVTGPGGGPFKGTTGLHGVGLGRTTSLPPSPQAQQMKALSWVSAQKDAAGRPAYRTPEQQALALQAYNRAMAGDMEGFQQLLAQANPQKVNEPGFWDRALATLGIGGSAQPSAVEAPLESPYADYPDARQGNDGAWYVQRNGQYFRIAE